MRAVLVKSLVYRRAVSAQTRRYAQLAEKQSANVEEMIADVGFGFNDKVK